MIDIRQNSVHSDPKASATFWLVGVGGGNVLGEQPQPLLALVVQPEIHLPP